MIEMITPKHVEIFNRLDRVGFNSAGYFGITEDGEKVSISREEYDAVNFIADQFFMEAADFEAWIAAMEDQFEDMAEWESAKRMGYSFS